MIKQLLAEPNPEDPLMPEIVSYLFKSYFTNTKLFIVVSKVLGYSIMVLTKESVLKTK